MFSSSKPDHIYFCDSIENLLTDKIYSLPIEQAENIISQHRKINKFTWMEIFDDSEIINAYSTQLIDPNKIAICYFGKEVGFGLVAIKPIKMGEMLIFTGETYIDLKPDDHSNPYISYTDSPTGYINAKLCGGFASMLLDLPSEEEATILSRRTRYNLHEIAYENFNIDMEEVLPSKKTTICKLAANRDINPKEPLGAAYSIGTRLMYSTFVGLSSDASCLPSSVNAKLNKIIYRPIHYRDLSEHQILLYKMMRDIKLGKIEKAINYLEKWILNAASLQTVELEEIIRYMQEKQLLISSENKKFILYANLLSIIKNEINLRNGEIIEFNERKLVELIVESNSKQIEYKSKSDIHIHDNDLDNYQVAYPGIAKDLYDIAKQYERCKNQGNALSYYKYSLFYLKNDSNSINTENISLMREVEEKVNRLQ